MFEDPSEKKKSKLREIVAISAIVLIAMYFFSRPKPQVIEQLPQQQTLETKHESVVNNVKEERLSSVIPAYLNKSVKEKKILKETDRFQLSFSSYYGTLNNIVTKDYKDANKNNFNITPLLKFNTENSSDSLVLPLIYKISGLKMENGFSVRETENQIIFSQRQNGVVLTKTYSLKKDSFDVGLTISIKNESSSDIFTEGQLSWGYGLGPYVKPELQITYDKNITLSYFDTEKDDEVKIRNEQSVIRKNINWVSLDNRYFLMAIIPKSKKDYSLDLLSNSKSDIYNQVLRLSESIQLKPGEELIRDFSIYLGPKKKDLLSSYNVKLERIVERGWFFFPLLGGFLISILSLINSVVGSYALAIIIFSALLKIVFHPLNQKSMIMMSRQADLQVKVTAIKEKYPDKVTQNAKMMELYKKENANPLKGCLPLLIQIPFFIAFYNELPVLINLATENFLWIKDLSSPDTVYLIEAFKNIPLLPYRLNILPIVIAILTFYQTWLTSRTQKQVNPQAKMMMYLMPIIFLFILWNAPSGLNLYWLIQTVGTILAQMYFNKNKTRILENAKVLTKKNKKLKK